MQRHIDLSYSIKNNIQYHFVYFSNKVLDYLANLPITGFMNFHFQINTG